MDKETLYYFLDELESAGEPFCITYKDVRLERQANVIRIIFSDLILAVVLAPGNHAPQPNP